MNENMGKEWLSPKDIQEWLGCGKTMIYELLNTPPPKGIPHHRIGKKIIVRRQEVLAWLRQHLD